MDWSFLFLTFIVSLFASILASIMVIKFKAHSDAVTNERNLRIQSIHHDNKNAATSCRVCKISPVPITPPIKTHQTNYWMEGKWKEEYMQNSFRWPDSYSIIFDKLPETELFPNKITENNIYSKLLMQLIPCLSKDVIQIILIFARSMDQCISKYALLNCTYNKSNQYINFSVANIEKMNPVKTIKKMKINSSTSFAEEILNKIPQRKIECTVYFHDNYNAMIEGQYFVLNIAKRTHILCQFGRNDDVYLIKEIFNLKWPASGLSSTWDASNNRIFNLFPSTTTSPLLEVKYDGRYIYAAKDNTFCVNIYDKKYNIIQPMTHLIDKSNVQNIEYYQLYDEHMISSLPESKGYLMISRRYYTKLELYQIAKDDFFFNNYIYLCHEFELEHIFNKMNNEYNRRFNIDKTTNDLHPRWDTILAFEMNDNNILFCVYYNAFLNRLFAANIKLSIFENPKLINYTLLDGTIGGDFLPFNMYSKCSGIEAIYTNKGKEWLIFCDLGNESGIMSHETEFRVQANELMVKYGKRKEKQCYHRYLRSLHRKQMS